VDAERHLRMREIARAGVPSSAGGNAGEYSVARASKTASIQTLATRFMNSGAAMIHVRCEMSVDVRSCSTKGNGGETCPTDATLRQHVCPHHGRGQPDERLLLVRI